MIAYLVVMTVTTLLVYFVRYACWGTQPVEPVPDTPALIAARRAVLEIERLAMGIV